MTWWRRLTTMISSSWIGLAAAVVTATLWTVVLSSNRQEAGTLDAGLLYLILVVAVARVWGVAVGLVAAAVDYACLNYFFIEPLHRFVVHDPKNVGAWILETCVFAAAALLAGVAPLRDRVATWRAGVTQPRARPSRPASTSRAGAQSSADPVRRARAA